MLGLDIFDASGAGVGCACARAAAVSLRAFAVMLRVRLRDERIGGVSFTDCADCCSDVGGSAGRSVSLLLPLLPSSLLDSKTAAAASPHVGIIGPRGEDIVHFVLHGEVGVGIDDVDSGVVVVFDSTETSLSSLLNTTAFASSHVGIVHFCLCAGGGDAIESDVVGLLVDCVIVDDGSTFGVDAGVVTHGAGVDVVGGVGDGVVGPGSSHISWS